VSLGRQTTINLSRSGLEMAQTATERGRVSASVGVPVALTLIHHADRRPWLIEAEMADPGPADSTGRKTVSSVRAPGVVGDSADGPRSRRGVQRLKWQVGHQDNSLHRKANVTHNLSNRTSQEGGGRAG
jgi:hypothetical protein